MQWQHMLLDPVNAPPTLHLFSPCTDWEMPAEESSGGCNNVMLTASLWITQTWYPWPLEMFTHLLTLLSHHKGLLFNRKLPSLVRQQLQLATWRVSGMPTNCDAFQAKLQELCQHGGERELTQLTSQVGLSGLAVLQCPTFLGLSARAL